MLVSKISTKVDFGCHEVTQTHIGRAFENIHLLVHRILKPGVEGRAHYLIGPQHIRCVCTSSIMHVSAKSVTKCRPALSRGISVDLAD